MNVELSTIMQASMIVLCLATIGLHLALKNINEARLYAVQSFAVVTLLVASALDKSDAPLLIVAAMLFVIKVALAPWFFARLIKRHKLKFSAKTYANPPQILTAILAVFLLANSSTFLPLTNLVPVNHAYLVLALAAVLVSILLMIDRKGVLSQAVGVLSLENSIVAFAALAGLEQSAALQAGIIFDIIMWVVIASVMVSRVYRHTGSLDVTNMKRLRD